MKKCILWGNWVSKRSRKGLGETLTIKKTFFNLHFKCQQNNNLSTFKSLDSIASVVGIFMYLTISKFKQVLRSRKGLGKVSTTTLVCLSPEARISSTYKYRGTRCYLGF